MNISRLSLRLSSLNTFTTRPRHSRTQPIDTTKQWPKTGPNGTHRPSNRALPARPAQRPELVCGRERTIDRWPLTHEGPYPDHWPLFAGIDDCSRALQGCQEHLGTVASVAFADQQSRPVKRRWNSSEFWHRILERQGLYSKELLVKK